MRDSKFPAEALPGGSGRDGVEFVLIGGLIVLLLMQATLLVVSIV